MIVTSVQIKTVKTQKHLYCPVFTKIPFTFVNGIFTFYLLLLHSYLKIRCGAVLPPIVNEKLCLALFVLQRYKYLPSAQYHLTLIVLSEFVQKMR